MAPIRALCDARGIALIEDCAHCFIGEAGGRPVGAWGDYAIASSMKFLPIYEGGATVSAHHRLDGVALRSAGAGFEAKVALTSLEKVLRMAACRPCARPVAAAARQRRSLEPRETPPRDGSCARAGARLVG
ncbi:DegT/DnrJ/EryC1/StrS family aminotransferase [Massilia sp. Dwa41.01b]|uniref:DegT/DnrJ/EryC1/StrS family aminotransferase n=1 Tax=Massilia sp. Dwa41.01b TaxID=2709302 RepID=UPI00227736A4|nr:DegT/DnrJ/EryC1/StrS family aminotransferase [Massilia sp. Dwa41.01b]